MAVQIIIEKITSFFEYNTEKFVHIKNKKIGCSYRIIQLVIVLFIFVWGIVIQKGYQITGPITGTITTKLKGASYYNGSFGDYSEGCTGAQGDINRTFDVGDYVIPPQERNSFFVLTNLWQTCNQTQGLCAESLSVYNSSCNLSLGEENNPHCLDDNGQSFTFQTGNGPTTGVCVPVGDGSGGVGQCQIRAWCDVEDENDNVTKAGPKIDASEFTVLVKASIEFPTIQRGKRKRNIAKDANPTFLKTCRFDESNEETLYCPIFSLKQIVDMIVPKQDFRNISVKGAVVGLEMTWDCDHLEWNLNHCRPKYIAKRYDDPTAEISQGFNFRHARYYEEDGVQKRILTKAYGILFRVELYGTGGKFNILTLGFRIGSMIGLLGIATLLCDFLVSFLCCKKSKYYNNYKYENLNDSPAKKTDPESFEIQRVY